MSSTNRNMFVGVTLTVLILSTLSGAREFAAAGEASVAFAYAIAVPGFAIYELWRAWKNGPLAADAAARMLFAVAMASILGGVR